MTLFSFSAGFHFREAFLIKLFLKVLKKKCLGRYSSFLIKFVIFATVLYLFWSLIAPAYFSAILKITAAYFELIGIVVSLNPTPDFLYSQGIRSCIPPFIALILATNLSFKKKALPKKPFFEKKITKRKFSLSLRESAILKGLIIGIPVLFVFRTILQISYVYLQIPPAPSEFYAIFVIFLSGTCRVALPFMLWLALSYKQLLPRPESDKYIRRGKYGYICPFCGAEKSGILDHIKDVHGEEALKSEKVKQLLKQNPQIRPKIKK